MRLRATFVILICTPVILFAQDNTQLSKNKAAAIQYLEDHRNDLITWSNQVWEYAEPSFHETRSSRLLIDILKKEGFTVKENLCGLSTVFMASYGTARPVIGLYGEYDADAGASNKVVPRKEELSLGGYGHGGCHNLLGVGSLGTALAIKELVQQGRLNCTIRYYGSTAEGSEGIRAYMARDGYFDDLDFSLYWHPSPVTWASTGKWDALIEMDIIFMAKAVNIIFDSLTANTLDAHEMLIQKMQSFREQMSGAVKINYVVREWKDDINIVPDTIKTSVKIQCAQQADADKLFGQISNAVKDISLKTNVKGIVAVKKAMHQFLPNVTAMQTVQSNMELLGPILYTQQEQEFVKELQQYLKKDNLPLEDRIPAFSDHSKTGKIYGYASDIGDASWIGPEVYFVVKSLAPVNMHQWQGTIFSGSSIGHKGMLQAAKVLSMTIVDYVESGSLQDAIKRDFIENTKSYKYHSILSTDVFRKLSQE